MDTLDKAQTFSQIKVSVVENGKQIKGEMKDGKFFAFTQEGSDIVPFVGVSKGNAVINRIMGFDTSDAIELLLRAANNRTRQRNYFRLYSQMLEGEISEEDFYETLDKNADDFVVEEMEKPTMERVMHALRLSKEVKNVDNSEELADLFSFDSVETDKQLANIERYEYVQ